MDKTGVQISFVQRHLRSKCITKLGILTASHIFKGQLSLTIKGRMNNYHRHFVAELKIKIQFSSLQLLTTHIKSFLFIPKFPAYLIHSSKLNDT